jgi:hypothetical protein
MGGAVGGHDAHLTLALFSGSLPGSVIQIVKCVQTKANGIFVIIVRRAMLELTQRKGAPFHALSLSSQQSSLIESGFKVERTFFFSMVVSLLSASMPTTVSCTNAKALNVVQSPCQRRSHQLLMTVIGTTS